jgi:ribosomal protein S18 acetylase RimI-like enzyme
MAAIEIVDYQRRHQPYFEAFNRAWIEELFEMEPVDEWVLTNPDKAILEGGGAIIMAEYNGIPAGTVALRKVAPGVFEFTKMAVDSNYRRKGIAEAICYASFLKAKELGAIKLYEKIGFRHLEVEPGVYKRANVKMEIGIEEAVNAAKNYNKHPDSFPIAIGREEKV